MQSTPGRCALFHGPTIVQGRPLQGRVRRGGGGGTLGWGCRRCAAAHIVPRRRLHTMCRPCARAGKPPEPRPTTPPIIPRHAHPPAPPHHQSRPGPQLPNAPAADPVGAMPHRSPSTTKRLQTEGDSVSPTAPPPPPNPPTPTKIIRSSLYSSLRLRSGGLGAKGTE